MIFLEGGLESLYHLGSLGGEFDVFVDLFFSASGSRLALVIEGSRLIMSCEGGLESLSIIFSSLSCEFDVSVICFLRLGASLALVRESHLIWLEGGLETLYHLRLACRLVSRLSLFVRFFRLGAHSTLVIERAVDYGVCGFEVSNFQLFSCLMSEFFLGDEFAHLFQLGY